MSGIVEFLKARLDEDEAAALAANGPRWSPGDGNISEGGLYALDESGDGWSIAWFELGTANEGEDGQRQLPRRPKMKRYAHDNSVHAARHDPERVLREVDAKRRLLAMFPDPADGDGCNEAGAQVLEVLAAAYDTHPDYRDEWRALIA